MKSSNQSSNKFFSKRTFIEWGVIGAVIAILYLTGLHTTVIGSMQRALLWTGFFDANISKISTTEGPHLSATDFRFAMQNASRNVVELSEFKGDVVFINVWASWCPPCIAEMPTIQTLYENVNSYDNIRFILLSTDQKREKAVQFMKSREFEMPYFFPASSLPQVFRSQYLPTTYVISKQGQVVYKKEGIADYSSQNFARWLIDLAQQ